MVCDVQSISIDSSINTSLTDETMFSPQNGSIHSLIGAKARKRSCNSFFSFPPTQYRCLWSTCLRSYFNFFYSWSPNYQVESGRISLTDVIHVSLVLGLLYNLPDLCVNAQWNSTAVTIINRTDLGSQIRGIFIDSNDRFYALQSARTNIAVCSLTNSFSTISAIIVGNISTYSSPYVTEERYLYFESGEQPGGIIRRSLDSTENVTAADFGDECRGLFVDKNNTLYSSHMDQHRVATQSLNDTSAVTVATNFDLYEGDADHHRIQVFRLGDDSTTTIVEPGTHGMDSLGYPTDVILDRSDIVFM